MKKLIIIQEHQEIEVILRAAKSINENEKYDNIIVVLNTDFETADDSLDDLATDDFNTDNVILMFDYFYKRYKNDSSLLVGFEHIEECDDLHVYIPSTCNSFTDVIKIASNMINDHERLLSSKILNDKTFVL